MKWQRRTRVRIDGIKLDNINRIEKAYLVQEEMEIIINSKIFAEKLISKLTKRNYSEGETSAWAKALPPEILCHLLTGAETLTPIKDWTIQIQVDDFVRRWWSKVKGYTYKSTPMIYISTGVIDKKGTKFLGSLCLHEYGHKIGFEHDFFATARRPDSLCYLLNEVYDECWDEMFGESSSFDKVLVCSRSWKTLWLKKSCRYVQLEYSSV